MEKFKLKSLIQNTLILLLVLLGNAQAGDKITFYHYDLQGSPVATTNEKGEVTWREEYSPYGEKLLKQDAGQDNVRGYTGHVFDEETGLTYMQARYYDPQTGRFMGVDPVGFDANNPISFNRYAYGNNNPYKYTDPNGELPSLDDAFWGGYDIGGILAGVAGIGYGLATDDSSYVDAGMSMVSESALGFGETALGMVNPSKVPGLKTISKVVDGIPKTGRGKNHLSPDPKAKGDHSTFRTDEDNNVTHHAEWTENPLNPTGFDEVKRVDTQYSKSHSHRNKKTGEEISTPHVHDKNTEGGVRPSDDNELPE